MGPAHGGTCVQVLKGSDSKEARSRREQRGWTGARNKNQESRNDSVFVPSRREAARREQAQRDNAHKKSTVFDAISFYLISSKKSTAQADCL